MAIRRMLTLSGSRVSVHSPFSQSLHRSNRLPTRFTNFNQSRWFGLFSIKEAGDAKAATTAGHHHEHRGVAHDDDDLEAGEQGIVPRFCALLELEEEVEEINSSTEAEKPDGTGAIASLAESTAQQTSTTTSNLLYDVDEVNCAMVADVDDGANEVELRAAVRIRELESLPSVCRDLALAHVRATMPQCVVSPQHHNHYHSTSASVIIPPLELINMCYTVMPILQEHSKHDELSECGDDFVFCSRVRRHGAAVAAASSSKHESKEKGGSKKQGEAKHKGSKHSDSSSSSAAPLIYYSTYKLRYRSVEGPVALWGMHLFRPLSHK